MQFFLKRELRKTLQWECYLCKHQKTGLWNYEKNQEGYHRKNAIQPASTNLGCGC